MYLLLTFLIFLLHSLLIRVINWIGMRRTSKVKRVEGNKEGNQDGQMGKVFSYHPASMKLLMNFLNNKYEKNVTFAFAKFKENRRRLSANFRQGFLKIFSVLSKVQSKNLNTGVTGMKKIRVRSYCRKNFINLLCKISSNIKEKHFKKFFRAVKNLDKNEKAGIPQTPKQNNQNRLIRKPSIIGANVEQKPIKTIDERNRIKNERQEQEINRILQQIDSFIKAKDEKRLINSLKEIVTKYSKSSCLLKGFKVFKGFRSLMGIQGVKEGYVKDFNILVKVMLSDQKHIDYELKEIRERKKKLEEERKNIKDDPDKVLKIEKDLKNLEDLFNLIIGHYEGTYEHKRRTRKPLKSKGNRSQYTGTDRYTIIQELSFDNSGTASHAKQKKLKIPYPIQPSIQKSHVSYAIVKKQENVPQAVPIIQNSNHEKERAHWQQEIIKAENHYKQSRRILEEYQQTLKGIELLSLELRSLNKKISLQDNYANEVKKIYGMSLKEEIGIKSEVMNLYQNLQKQMRRKVSEKQREIKKFRNLYEQQRNRNQAIQAQLVEKNKRVKLTENGFKEERCKMNQEIQELMALNKKLQNEIIQIKKESQSRQKKAMKKIQQLQDQSSQMKKQTQLKIEETETKNRHLNNEIKKKQNQNLSKSRKIANLEKENSKLEGQIQKFKQSLSKEKQKNSKLSYEIEFFKQNSNSLKNDKTSKIQEQVEELQSKFNDLVSEKNVESLQRLRKEIQELEKKNSILDQQRKNLEVENINLKEQNGNLKVELKIKEQSEELEQIISERGKKEKQQNQRMMKKLENKLSKIEGERKQTRIEILQKRIDELEKHIENIEQEHDKEKMMKKKAFYLDDDDSFILRRSRRKFSLIPAEQIVRQKLENAKFDSLPEFTEALLSEYLNIIKNLENQLQEVYDQNDILYEKLMKNKQRLRETFDENHEKSIIHNFLEIRPGSNNESPFPRSQIREDRNKRSNERENEKQKQLLRMQVLRLRKTVDIMVKKMREQNLDVATILQGNKAIKSHSIQGQQNTQAKQKAKSQMPSNFSSEKQAFQKLIQKKQKQIKRLEKKNQEQKVLFQQISKQKREEEEKLRIKEYQLSKCEQRIQEVTNDFMRQEEININLLLEKEQTLKKLREAEWKIRLREAQDIQSKIFEQKQAKLKRDWYNSQLNRNNGCKNCVDLSHYFIYMETYMQKLVMFLISQKNLVLTYEYKEYCHQQVEAKLNKDSEKYIKQWFQFTKSLIQACCGSVEKRK